MKRMKTIKLDLQQQNILFTADTHLHHDNVIKYCDRHFGDVNKMDDAIVENWNAVVQPKDIIFILGDFCFGSQKSWIYFLKKLAGVKYLVIGNHDKSVTPNWFVDVLPMMNLLIRGDDEIKDGQRITCCHYPMVSWYHSHMGAWQAYGHVHGKLQGKLSPNQYDVGVDCNDFTPVSYQELKVYITRQNLKTDGIK